MVIKENVFERQMSSFSAVPRINHENLASQKTHETIWGKERNKDADVSKTELRLTNSSNSRKFGATKYNHYKSTNYARRPENRLCLKLCWVSFSVFFMVIFKAAH